MAGTVATDRLDDNWVGEENEELDGTACRRPEGFWGGSELTADAEPKGREPQEVEVNFSGNRLKSG